MGFQDRTEQSFLDAGVEGLNLSLDTFRRDRFTAITGLDAYDKVWRGIQAARQTPRYAPVSKVRYSSGISISAIPKQAKNHSAVLTSKSRLENMLASSARWAQEKPH